MSSVESRYIGGYVFHDPKVNFTLNLAGFSYVDDLTGILAKYDPAIRGAIAQIEEIESGKIANKTAVKSESENRAVDHYNHRMEEERVPGKSLAHSLRQWEEIRAAVNAIRDGTTKNEKGEKYTDVIFNGIGGSFLGPLMLVVSAKGTDFNNAPGATQKLHFVCNTDPETFTQTLERINLGTTIMVNISKSGGTAETKGNMDAFNDAIKAHNAKTGEALEMGKHNMAITTRGSKFDAFAQANKFMCVFYMENETGGRTSVMSAVGAVPAAFAGLDFDQFLQGECYMDTLTRRADAAQNPAMLIAIAIDVLSKRVGKKNMIVLGYSDALKEFAHYLQQLYMESLGKEYDVDGFPKPEGQTVFGGVGTGEQHAFMQQVQKGINDAFVRFVHFLERRSDYSLSGCGSMGRQLLAFVKGTENALTQNRKPYITTTYRCNNMFNLGMMVALEERIVTILGAFAKINAYDQPGVQDGKLAADQMNAVSLKVEERLAELTHDPAFKTWKGDVAQARTDIMRAAEGSHTPNLLYLDSILSDISANIELPNSYDKLRGKLSVQREFIETRFVYTISKL